MKEREIIALVKKELDDEGLWYWVAHKSPFYPQSDIFGLFDVVYYNHDGHSVYIQATTATNLSHRRAKIKGALALKGKVILDSMYIWAYDSKRKHFKKEKIQ